MCSSFAVTLRNNFCHFFHTAQRTWGHSRRNIRLLWPCARTPPAYFCHTPWQIPTRHLSSILYDDDTAVMLTRTWVQAKAKAKAKDLSFKPKAKAKDLSSKAKAKAKAKDLSFRAKARPRTWLKSLSQGQGLKGRSLRTGKDQGQRPRTRHRVENF